ncbi:MAG: PEP/pyruvate-binding domain-containing protein [Candidatus Kerfeldbacteria bacterium]|nr:PEP/pyruvate-binding domain-containing protein [Candidatus Kerfeldbacteria bacterium]
MTKFTKPFRLLSRTDVALAGGKGASLGEMARAGIPVPSGFVVLTTAFESFLDETDIDVEIEAQLHKINVRDVNSIERVSEDIRGQIMSVDMPTDIAKETRLAFVALQAPTVAVRSSATAEDAAAASWAGELESYLNVTKKDLLSAVQKCWASLFTPRAIFYRFENKLHRTKVSVAVVVQAMIQSDVSGICFTVHPVTKDYDQMVIEAGWGLGEAIVGGKITPDTYVIHKKGWEILDINVSEQKKIIVRGQHGTIERPVPPAKKTKQKLSKIQILALSKLCAKIENHYRRPQDIEWAWQRGNFYILQSRPITTL